MLNFPTGGHVAFSTLLVAGESVNAGGVVYSAWSTASGFPADAVAIFAVGPHRVSFTGSFTLEQNYRWAYEVAAASGMGLTSVVMDYLQVGAGATEAGLITTPSGIDPATGLAGQIALAKVANVPNLTQVYTLTFPAGTASVGAAGTLVISRGADVDYVMTRWAVA